MTERGYQPAIRAGFSGQAVLAADTTIVGGAPVASLVSLNASIPSGIAYVSFSVSGRGGADGAGWKNITFQLLVDAVVIKGMNCGAFNYAIAPVATTGSLLARVSGLAAGLHTFTIAVSVTEVAPNSFTIFPVARPNTDNATLIVQELLA